MNCVLNKEPPLEISGIKNNVQDGKTLKANENFGPAPSAPLEATAIPNREKFSCMYFHR